MRKVIKIIGLIGILAIIGFIVFFGHVKLTHFMYTSPYFNLREVNISGGRYVTREKILVLSGFSSGGNIFKLDIAGSARKIEAHPLIKEARITRKLPDTIDIRVNERIQVAYIVLLGKRYGMDDEGAVLPLLDEKLNLPTVTGFAFSKVTVGERLDQAGVKSALNVINNIRKAKLDEYIDIAEISVVKPSQPVLYTAKERTEIRLGNFPLCNQFESLKLILVDLREKGAGAEYIDLRFGEKIVVKEKKGL